MPKIPAIASGNVPFIKLTDYLMNEHHPVGRAKAAFLFRHGFVSVNPGELSVALLDHASRHEFEEMISNRFGDKYVVLGELRSPDGRDPMVRTVWIVERGETAPRFVTLVPVRR